MNIFTLHFAFVAVQNSDEISNRQFMTDFAKQILAQG